MQSLLANPNPSSPAQIEAFQLFTSDREAYDEKVRKLAKEQPIHSEFDADTKERFFALDSNQNAVLNNLS